MRRSLKAALAAVAATALAAPLATAGTATAAPHAPSAPIPPRTPAADFNHDGYTDLVAASPGGTVAGKEAGYVSVVYGSASGPDKAHAQTISRETAGVPGEPAEYGNFGQFTSAADLDGDGYTDLVVVSYNGDKPLVLWGAKDGLSGTRHAELADIPGRATTGDFNGDGHQDLVSDRFPTSDDPNEDLAGMTVSYGPFTRAGKPASDDAIETGRTFGPGDLIAGDMTGDGVDDLVTSHGFEEMAYASRFWKGGKDGLAHTSKSLKSTLGGAIADFDGDGYGDLAARDNGTNNDDNESDKGTVRIEYGSASGPSGRITKITQDTAGVPGVGETGDQFGAVVSAGDVNGDGYADLAAGIPGEAIGSVKGAGSVVLLKGAPKASGGLTGKGAQAFTQSTAGVPGASETQDRFGSQVLLSDTNGDKRADLTVSAPQEDGTYKDSGAAWILRGAKTGLTTTAITSFGPAAVNAPERKEARFGNHLGDR
ncbi:FG-GAP-like repeat-containing protein [Streptomyces aureoverticillatus]|uniref:FG-GAP-like repeat-containing protein n=1 Tax=Streptomyces aureoverticillatus TaxID=66871 RepID=UPI0013DBF8B4|nr:FG-GAP-like repeat-containing protein [Streptomyces aureoverticillatus]QIB45198.1 hypothetical protein G3H79_21115 [Streptomyces aureoverticillatus]